MKSAKSLKWLIIGLIVATISIAADAQYSIWAFNQSATLTAINQYGFYTSANLTLVGMDINAAWVTNGKYGNATIFDGTDDFMRLDKVGAMNHPTTFLYTPTYEGSNQSTHPDVYYNASGWGTPSWKYWMAMTPYPNSTGKYENPSILVSNDSLTWTVPVGLTNPIDADPGGTAYNSDPEILVVDDTMWVYYLEEIPASSTSVISRRNSTDGVNWGGEQNLTITTTYMQFASPAIVHRNGLWEMFANNDSGGCTSKVGLLLYYNSTDGLTWAGPYKPTFTPRSDITLWHLNVEYAPTKNQYMMFWEGYDNLVGTPGCGKQSHMFYANSTNGQTWQTYTNPLMYDLLEPTQWDEQSLYRPTTIYHSAIDTIELWYGGFSDTSGAAVWHIGYQNETLTNIQDRIVNNRNPLYTPEGTICMWINQTVANTGNGLFGDRYDSGLGQNTYRELLFSSSNLKMAYSCKNGTAEVAVVQGAGLNANYWTHACVTWNTTTQTYYKNGTFANSSGTTCPSTNDNLLPIRVGSYYSGGTTYSFEGILDEIYIFNYTLTPAEIINVRDNNPPIYTPTTTTTTTTTTLPPSISDCRVNASEVLQGSYVWVNATVAQGTAALDRFWFSLNATIWPSLAAAPGVNNYSVDTAALLGNYSLVCFVNDTVKLEANATDGWLNVVTTTTSTTVTTTTSTTTTTTTLAGVQEFSLIQVSPADGGESVPPSSQDFTLAVWNNTNMSIDYVAVWSNLTGSWVESNGSYGIVNGSISYSISSDVNATIIWGGYANLTNGTELRTANRTYFWRPASPVAYSPMLYQHWIMLGIAATFFTIMGFMRFFEPIGKITFLMSGGIMYLLMALGTLRMKVWWQAGKLLNYTYIPTNGEETLALIPGLMGVLLLVITYYHAVDWFAAEPLTTQYKKVFGGRQ